MCSRLLALCALCVSLTGAAQGDDEPQGKGVFLTPQEALDLAFPKAQHVRGTVVLDDDARTRVEKLSGADCRRGIAHPYTARDKDGKLLGTAWFDTHKVRTQRETLMVVVDAVGAVQRIEVLAFSEPKRFMPRAKWYAQYKGQKLNAKLNLKQDIRGISGATLTARATTDAVRRVLALHQVCEELQRAKAEEQARRKRVREEARKKREAAEEAKRKKEDR